jgi:hypothetical protein
MENNGDFLQVAVTTAIAASAAVVSTNLKEYDFGTDGYFDNWWVYIKDQNNAAVERRTGSTTYATATGTLTVYGGNLSSDGANLANIQLCRYSRKQIYEKAIQRAIEDTYPSLKRYIEDITLIAGNSLPNSHFEDWASSSYPDYWRVTNATAAADTTAADIRGGLTSAKVTASAGNGYMSCNSDNWPWLRDLMGEKITVKVWATPQTANDAAIVIYTTQADGTAQTLTSTTACPAGEETLIELNDQQLNDDLTFVEIRLKVTTSGQYVIFDDCRLTGYDRKDHLLPAVFDNGNVDKVYVQVGGDSSFASDDLHPRYWVLEPHAYVYEDRTTKYIRLPHYYTDSQRIKIMGTAPLESLTSATDTVTLNETSFSNKLIAYAQYLLFDMVEGPVSASDKGRFEAEKAKAYAKYLSMSSMHTEPSILRGL